MAEGIVLDEKKPYGLFSTDGVLIELANE
jgi:hypothetical protein